MNKKENLPEWFKYKHSRKEKKMTDETKKYLRSQERTVQTPEEIGMTNKLLEIVNVINSQLSPEQRIDMFNGNLNSKDQIVSQYLDFISLTVKYLLFDLEASKREIAELHNLLEGNDDGCDLAS